MRASCARAGGRLRGSTLLIALFRHTAGASNAADAEAYFRPLAAGRTPQAVA
ncbi:MAG: hypothetical protein V8S95_03500 [Odoribacter sp.]